MGNPIFLLRFFHTVCIIIEKQAGEGPDLGSVRRRFSMFTVSAVLNILALDIILALVLVAVYRKQNNAFGHALSQDAKSGSH